jgi:hypothetical protein
MNGARLSHLDRPMSLLDAEPRRSEDDDVELDEDELDNFIKGVYGSLHIVSGMLGWLPENYVCAADTSA